MKRLKKPENITLIDLAGYLLNENIGTDRELLNQMSEDIAIEIGILDRVMNSPDFDMPYHQTQKIFRYFGYDIKQCPRGHILSINLNKGHNVRKYYQSH